MSLNLIWSTNTLWIRRVPGSNTCSVWDQHDTNTCNYTKSCDFLKLFVVSACQCLCRVQYSCTYPCFTLGNLKFMVAVIKENKPELTTDWW